MLIFKPVDSNRSIIVDAVKAFAIVCVVVAHCIQFGSGPNYLSASLYYENFLFKTIVSFHMPLFMLVSGYLFASSVDRYSASSLLKKRMKSLLFPILSWAIVVVLIGVASAYINGERFYSLGEYISRFVYVSFHHLWFLWALIWNSLITLLVHKYCKDSVYVYLLVLIATFFLPDAHNIYLYKFMCPFFVVGYFYSKYSSLKNIAAKHENTLFLIALAVFVILLAFYNRQTYIYTSGYTLLRESGLSIGQLLIDLHRFFIGLFGSVVIIIMIKKLLLFCGNASKSVIGLIGAQTLGIYIVSDIIVNPHFLRTISIHLTGVNYGVLALESLLTILFSLIVISIVKRIPVAKSLFLGL